MCKAYGCIEVFAGVGWITKVMRANGVATASFDIELGQKIPGKQDAMDMLTDPGFAPFVGKKCQ